MSYRAPAVIVDVDGTLCNVSTAIHHVTKRPKDFDAFHRASAKCPPYRSAIAFCREHYVEGRIIVVVTARMQQWRKTTIDWLNRYMPIPYDGPYHRSDSDHRPDHEVKRDLLRYLSRRYKIEAAMDDSPKVIEMFESLGIPTTLGKGWRAWQQK